MSNEVLNAEDMLKEVAKVLKWFNILWMTNYLGCDPSIYNIWKRRKVLPYRNVKRMVEYLEMHNDDVVCLCEKLMDYYNSEKKKRDDRIEATAERNRERSRQRYLNNK